jgi:gamma-glutamyltranspeptidase/glutathione hydrolase
MIAAAHPLASDAALAMLRAGGNAADAAVAASFVISVVRPQSTGIGGGGFLLLTSRVRSESLPTKVYDFRERAPGAATRNMYLDDKGQPKAFTYAGKSVPDASINGHLAAGVPGLVAGLHQVHHDHGVLPWETVLAPAIKAARDGFEVYPGLAEAIADRAEILAVFPGSRAIFLPGGKPLVAGQTLVQKDLAWTLDQVAKHGPKAFYEGAVAKKIVAEMQRGKGLISAVDLKNYAVKRREPVTGHYRGHKIVSMPPPSSGGTHIVQMLNMLSHDDLGAMGHGSVAATHLVAETMRRAFADRAEYLGDPDFVRVPVRGLTALPYAAALRATIDVSKATPSSGVKAGQPMAHESASTTHLSVVDKNGMAVATTQTVNYTFGSCVVAEGTGILLNDEMDDFSLKPGVPNVFGLVGSDANAIAAHKTMLSSMSPTMVFRPDGSFMMALGSPGGPRIISATLQTILNVIDHRMDYLSAVHAARIHHQWLPDQLVFEPGGLGDGVQAELRNMGHNVVAKGTIGDVQLVAKEGDKLIGVSDRRSEGAPRGY